jgi:hypothetical protein
VGTFSHPPSLIGLIYYNALFYNSILVYTL